MQPLSISLSPAGSVRRSTQASAPAAMAGRWRRTASRTESVVSARDSAWPKTIRCSSSSARARASLRLGRRGGRFRLHLAAPGVLVEHEHDRQDEERRAQRHAVGVFDVAGGVEDIEQGTLENDHQSEDKAGKQEGILRPITRMRMAAVAGDVPPAPHTRLNDLR